MSVAAASIRWITASVSAIGVPTGIFSVMLIVSASFEVMKVKGTRPPTTIPTETISTATAAVSVR